jgi:IS30 family transposase
MDSENYRRITLEERYKIDAYVALKKGPSEIGRLLNRPRSTISREIKRGKKYPGGYYQAMQAHMHAEFNNKVKRVDSKLRSNPMLKYYVYKGLIKHQSPEQIANRIKSDYPSNTRMRICYESIYKHIYFETTGRFQKKLIELLPYRKPIRKGGNKRHIYLGKIPGRVTINERPEVISNRLQVGHWEGDLVVGKGQTSAIGTLVERVTRYTIIIALQSRKSRHVVDAFADALLEMPKSFLKSLTYDNGVEMSEHKYFTHRTKMPVYFANPYSSWERGTNENTNGLIRRFFPKKTDFNKISDAQLKNAEHNLNDRPRKVLNWKTPRESVQESCVLRV